MKSKFIFQNFLKQRDTPTSLDYNFTKTPTKAYESPNKLEKSNEQSILFNENLKNQYSNKNYYKSEKITSKDNPSCEKSHLKSMLNLVEADKHLSLVNSLNYKEERDKKIDLLAVSEVICDVEFSECKRDLGGIRMTPVLMPANKIYKNQMYQKKNKYLDVTPNTFDRKNNHDKEKLQKHRNIFSMQNVNDLSYYTDTKKDSVLFQNSKVSNTYHKSNEIIMIEDSKYCENSGTLSERNDNLDSIIEEQKENEFNRKTNELIRKIKFENPIPGKNKMLSTSLQFKSFDKTPKVYLENKFDNPNIEAKGFSLNTKPEEYKPQQRKWNRHKLNLEKLNNSIDEKGIETSALTFAHKNEHQEMENEQNNIANDTFGNQQRQGKNPRLKLSCLRKDKNTNDFTNIFRQLDLNDQIHLENSQHKILEEKDSHIMQYKMHNPYMDIDYFHAKVNTQRNSANKILNKNHSPKNLHNKSLDKSNLRSSLRRSSLDHEKSNLDKSKQTTRFDSSVDLHSESINYYEQFKMQLPHQKKYVKKLKLENLNALPGIRNKKRLAQTERDLTNKFEMRRNQQKAVKGNITNRLFKVSDCAASKVYRANQDKQAGLPIPRYQVNFLMDENVNQTILDKKTKIREKTIASFDQFVTNLRKRLKSDNNKLFEQYQFDENLKKFVVRHIQKVKVDKHGKVVVPTLMGNDEAEKIIKSLIHKDGAYLPLSRFLDSSRELFFLIKGLIDDLVANSGQNNGKIKEDLDFRVEKSKKRKGVEITSDHKDWFDWTFADAFSEQQEKVRREATGKKKGNTSGFFKNLQVKNDDIAIVDGVGGNSIIKNSNIKSDTNNTENSEALEQSDNDSNKQANKKKLFTITSKAELEGIVKQAFDLYDDDKSGFLEKDEIKILLDDACAELMRPNITDAQLDAIIKTVDDNGDGKFDFDELFKIIGPILEKQLENR